MRAVLTFVLASAFLLAATRDVRADNRIVFAGCVVERADTSVVLATTGNEIISVDTSWVASTMADALTAECVTVKVLVVDGRYVAESVDAGDEPNEVNSLTNETTRDRR